MTARALGPAVLIDGNTLPTLRYAVAVAVREKHRAGMAPGPLLDQLDQAAAHALESANRHTDAPIPPSGPPSDQWIDTAEVARRLGCTPRTAQRLAPRLDGRKIGGVWLVDPDTLNEYLDGKEHQNGN